MHCIAWNVYYKGKLYTTVFYSPGITQAEVLQGLIEHDGYPSGIVVVRQR